MYKNFQDILLDILTITNYKNDKEKFIQEFEESNYTEAGLNLLDTLVEEEKNNFKKILLTGNIQIVKDYFSDKFDLENFSKEVNAVRAKALKDFLRVLLPTLSSEQIRRIDEVLGSQIDY